MRNGRIVMIVGGSAELDLALDALEGLDLPVRVIPTLAEAERLLLGADHPLLSAVLVHIGPHPTRAMALVRALHRREALASIPIAVWAQPTSGDVLTEAYEAGARSGVLLDGTDDDAVKLARMIHYWAAANHPPYCEALA